MGQRPVYHAVNSTVRIVKAKTHSIFVHVMSIVMMFLTAEIYFFAAHIKGLFEFNTTLWGVIGISGMVLTRIFLPVWIPAKCKIKACQGSASMGYSSNPKYTCTKCGHQFYP